MTTARERDLENRVAFLEKKYRHYVKLNDCAEGLREQLAFMRSCCLSGEKPSESTDLLTLWLIREYDQLASADYTGGDDE